MSATYSLGRSPKSLTSCPFALYTAWEKASQVVPLYSCMSATYSLVQSPTCLTSCPFVALYVGNLQHKLSRPFVALYFGIPPKSLKLSLACQQPTVLRPPKSLTFGALYVGNLQPRKVPKMPHKLSLCSPVCPQPTALAGAKKHHKLSLCGPVCQQPTAMGGAKKASQVVPL